MPLLGTKSRATPKNRLLSSFPGDVIIKQEGEMTRDELTAHIKKEYKVIGDRPFSGDFESTVFRHGDNRKWFALLMRIGGDKLGLSPDGAKEEKREVSFTLWKRKRKIKGRKKKAMPGMLSFLR